MTDYLEDQQNHEMKILRDRKEIIICHVEVFGRVLSNQASKVPRECYRTMKKYHNYEKWREGKYKDILVVGKDEKRKEKKKIRNYKDSFHEEGK